MKYSAKYLMLSTKMILSVLIINGSYVHGSFATEISAAKKELLSRALQVKTGIPNPTQHEIQMYHDIPYTEMEEHVQFLTMPVPVWGLNVQPPAPVIAPPSVQIPPLAIAPPSVLGNWSETFRTLIPGILATHTPNSVTFGLISGRSINLSVNSLNGFPLRAPLILSVDSTRVEFIAAMLRAGVYNGRM